MYENDTYGGQHRGMRRAQLRRPHVAAALACLALVAAGCSSSASAGTGAAPPGGSAKPSALAFSKCMRAHGITDFPDPNSQGQIQINAKPGTDLERNNPQFQTAFSACQTHQHTPPGADPPQQDSNEAR